MKLSRPLRLVCLALAACGAAARAQEESHPASSSAEFNQSFDTAIKQLQKRDFGDELAGPTLGSASSDAYQRSLKAITGTWNTLATTPGSQDENYDIILQAGHYARKKGLTGTSGKVITEQQLAAYLVRRIAEALAQQGKLKVLTLSADTYAPRLKGKLFLAIHADGSTKPCSTGPSLSYQKNNSTLAMHAVGWALSQALGYQYDQFRKDGFTANAAHYYMFGRVDATVMKGLLEVGELTCEDVEKRLVAGADAIAANVAKALLFVHDAHVSANAVAAQ